MSVDAILEQVKALTPDERAEFFDRLDEEFPPDGVTRLPTELAQLLDARNAAADANPNLGYTIEEVIDYVKTKR